MALQRTAIVSCAALFALTLAAALLIRGGGGGGPFHVIETAATTTVEVSGLPAPSTPAARAERADLDQLARTALVLLLLAALAVQVTLFGVIAAENRVERGRRVIEVTLGAPPRRLMGAALRQWRRRTAVAGMVGGGVCAAAAAWLVRTAPPGTSLVPPAPWPAVAVLPGIALVVFAAGVAPVWRLYGRGRSLSGEAGDRQHTDPRPQQFNRVVLIVGQYTIAVAILASAGLLILSGAARPALPGEVEVGGEGAGGPGDGRVGAGRTVVGRLVPRADGAADSVVRAAAYESALDALREAPRLAAESLATPGAWLARGPEAVAVNECGPCMVGGMPDPIHRARVQVHAVMPGFFEQRGMRFVAGAGFGAGGMARNTEAPGDSADGGRSVVINQAYAWEHFVDPVGRTLTLGSNGEEVWYRVVGVVTGAAGGGLGASGSPFAVYYSALEHPPAEIELVTTVDVPPSAGLDDSLRVVRQVLDAAPEVDLAISDFRHAEDELARVYGTAGWIGGGMRTAGALAALVALAGITGTLRDHIRSRMREMGVRAALGAPPRKLRRMVVREALALAVAGTGLGLWAATFLVAFLSPVAVEIFSLPLFAGLAVVLVGAAVLVALPSAILAASADPRELMQG